LRPLDDDEEKFIDPMTGAHFEYMDICIRLARLLKSDPDRFSKKSIIVSDAIKITD
jgi:hypothetical protein